MFLHSLFISNFIGSPIIRPLESLISTKAISVSFVERMTNEILSEDRLLKMTTMWQPYEILNLVAITSLCLYMFISTDFGESSRDSRWNNIPIYSNTKKITEFILIVGFILLTRDVENAI